MPKGPHQEKPGPLPILTVEKVKMALEMTGGIKKAAAETLGVGRTTLYAFINNNPELKPTIEEIDETVLDMAEGKVITAIKAGDMQTCRWFLEMKGGDRGYSRRHQHSGPNGKAIQLEAPTVDVSGLSMAALKELRAAMLHSADESD